jgi:hypothetical protein
MTLTIGSQTIVLALRPSATERLELLASLPRDGTVPLRAAAAAVGWAWPSGPSKPPGRYSGDVAAYGRQVADHLLEQGVSLVEICRAGAAVLAAIAGAGIPGLGEVEAAARPTSPPVEVVRSTG